MQEQIRNQPNSTLTRLLGNNHALNQQLMQERVQNPNQQQPPQGQAAQNTEDQQKRVHIISEQSAIQMHSQIYRGNLTHWLLQRRYVVVQNLLNSQFRNIYRAIDIRQGNQRPVFIKEFFIDEVVNQAGQNSNCEYTRENILQFINMSVRNQKSLLELPQHRNISTYRAIYSSSNNCYMLEVTSSHNEGTLANLLTHFKVLQLEHALYILYELLRAIHSLNVRHLTHGFLRPEYIWMKDGVPFIGEFWLTAIIDKISDTQLCNTEAPEIRRLQFCQKSDVYSLAVLLYCMISSRGSIQQRCKQAKNLNQQILKQMKLKNDKELPQTIRLFFKKCLLQRPQNRWSIKQLSESSIFNTIKYGENRDSLKIIPPIYYKKIIKQETIIANNLQNNFRYTIVNSPTRNFQINQSRVQQIEQQNIITPLIVQYLAQQEFQKQKSKLSGLILPNQVYKKMVQIHLDLKLCELIYKQYVVFIENNHILDLNKRVNLQLMYMLAKRSLMFLNEIQVKLLREGLQKSSSIFHTNYSLIKDQVEQLRKSVFKKFQEYSDKLTKCENRLIQKLRQYFRDKTEIDQKNQLVLFNGFQISDHQKKQHIVFLTKMLQNPIIKKQIIDNKKLSKEIQSNILAKFCSFQRTCLIIAPQLKNKYVQDIFWENVHSFQQFYANPQTH